MDTPSTPKNTPPSFPGKAPDSKMKPPPPMSPKAAAASAPPESSDPLVTILNRNSFYRDGYRWLLKMAVGEAVVIAILVITLFTMISLYSPRDRYFATTAGGSLIPMRPLDEPNLDRGRVADWASKAAVRIMTFGFHDYRTRLTDSQEYFTDEGWPSFLNALEKARIIETMEGAQQVVTAVARQAVVVEEGLDRGVYTWVVQIPMTITYTSGSKEQSNNVLLTARVNRVPTIRNPEGIGIQQWLIGQ